MKQIIKRNAIRCVHCGDTIESQYTHDYVECSCGRVAVDGGHEYFRRCFQTPEDYEDLSEVESVQDYTHLCDSCTKHVAACDAEYEEMEFGDGTGGDNVVACASYESKHPTE